MGMDGSSSSTEEKCENRLEPPPASVVHRAKDESGGRRRRFNFTSVIGLGDIERRGSGNGALSCLHRCFVLLLFERILFLFRFSRFSLRFSRRKSDLSSERSMGDEDCRENEVQSAYNGPLDMMQPLEEVLPFSRGISKFYDGKSKSFTSLADAFASTSVKDIAKPQNAFTRKRRNLMALKLNHDTKSLDEKKEGVKKLGRKKTDELEHFVWKKSLEFSNSYDDTCLDFECLY
ncbi:Damaged dna-binding 2, putative isoform 1 [Senna tora]|uniref:Damaged dna-binding 2, putative isoform 1 n=1 Tax=Senna tora TaxID=362788 RepID=A0A834W7E7_9FABA|nr:Damaged dna-binding 2, putative isoform 1 [Senna tora]